MYLEDLIPFVIGLVMLYQGSLYGSVYWLIAGCFFLAIPMLGLIIGKQSSKPKLHKIKHPHLDYAKINAMERDLGLLQSDYSAFGVKPVDVTEQVIQENSRLLMDDSCGCLVRCEECTKVIRQREAFAWANSNVQPIDQPYPIEVIGPTLCTICGGPSVRHGLCYHCFTHSYAGNL